MDLTSALSIKENCLFFSVLVTLPSSSSAACWAKTARAYSKPPSVTALLEMHIL